LKAKSKRDEIMETPSAPSAAPNPSRDKTRSARARWAEISLKMHARSERERTSEPSSSLRMTERF